MRPARPPADALNTATIATFDARAPALPQSTVLSGPTSVAALPGLTGKAATVIIR